MTATIEEIFSAPEHGTPQSAKPQGQLTASVGLEGDRYAGDGVVSMIEAEAVAAFNAATGLKISAGATGRNLVTRGIRLNPLVGQRFRIGNAELEGTELCDPCATLGRLLATENLSAAEIVRHLAHSAGLRARVLSSGKIEPGSEVSVDS
jgi:MOSC domain-containing protein YiiM